MKSTVSVAILGAVANIARAQEWIGQDCDGAHFPEYDDCDEVIDFFKLRETTDVVAYNGEDGPEPSCTWWYWKDGNCRISTCWTVTNQYSKDNLGPDRLETTGDNVARGYDAVKGVCQKLSAGGRSDASESADGKSWTYFTVYNDPDQSPPSAKLRSRDGGPTPDRMVQEAVTSEQYEKWVKEVEEKQKQSKGTRAAGMKARDAGIMANKREDDDDSYYINNSGTNVRQEGVYDTGPRASNGIATEYSTTNSQSFTTTTSANIGGAFEFFSAGIGFEYSETTSFSVTQGMTFTPKCEGNQEGQAFYYPFFDYYDVTFSPSGQRAEIWVPVPEDDKFIKGELKVECIG